MNDTNLCARSIAAELEKMEDGDDGDDEEEQGEENEMKSGGSSSRKRKAPSHSP